jgi:hypothetical protein
VSVGHRSTGRGRKTLVTIALGLFAIALTASGCRRMDAAHAQTESGSPATGRTGKPAEPVALDGKERLEWDQAGKSLDEVRNMRYMAVIGQMARDVQDVRCEAKTPSGPFVCSGQLPEITHGVHQLRLIAVLKDGQKNLISRWSAPLAVEKR